VQGKSRHRKGKALTQTQNGRGRIDEAKNPFDDGENNDFSGFNDGTLQFLPSISFIFIKYLLSIGFVGNK
jgi:hypothetical protein